MATFVTADWVAERIGQPGYLIIDPRSAMRYLMGHLRGAVSVPYKKLQAPDGKLGPPEQLAAAFGDAGLGDDVTPILYDHQDGRNAAMAAWVLGYLGRDDVHIMDLRYEAWKDEGREVLYRPVLTRAAGFTVRLNPAIRATLDDVSNRGTCNLVDARTAEEFRGEFEADHRPGPYPRRRQSPPCRSGRRRRQPVRGWGYGARAAGRSGHRGKRTRHRLLPQRHSRGRHVAGPGPGWATPSACTTAPTPNGWIATSR